MNKNLHIDLYIILPHAFCILKETVVRGFISILLLYIRVI